MPRYNYQCSTCSEIRLYRHDVNEYPQICVACEATGSLSKSYQKIEFVSLNKNQNDNVNKQAIGTLTNEYIKENKRILDEHKQKLKKEEYE